MAETFKHTEQTITVLLRRKYGADSGNGPAWAFVPQVRNDAGFRANRTCDAIAMSLWPSRGLTLHGHEIKCSRSDWLNEYRDPSKAEAFAVYCDYFWLVIGDRKIIQAGEVPETWGVMLAHKTRIDVLQEPTKNENVQPIDRGFLAALLRQAGVVANLPPEEIARARAEGYQEGLAHGQDSREREKELLERRTGDLQDRLDDLYKTIGLDDLTLVAALKTWDYRRREAFYQAIRAVMSGEQDIKHLEGRLQRLVKDAGVLGEQAQRIAREHNINLLQP